MNVTTMHVDKNKVTFVSCSSSQKHQGRDEWEKDQRVFQGKGAAVCVCFACALSPLIPEAQCFHSMGAGFDPSLAQYFRLPDLAGKLD